MGEGRGKLETLIAELEAKKAELQNLIHEYELMLPHLTKAREALDDAGITDAAPVPAVDAAPHVEEPVADAPAPVVEAEAQPVEAPPATEEPDGAPARRSIASLVAEDEAAGDEATH